MNTVAAIEECPIEAPPGLTQMPIDEEALAAVRQKMESGTFRAPPGLETPPGLDLVRHSPPPGFAARMVLKKDDDDNSSEKSTDAEGCSGACSTADSMNSPFQTQLNPYAKEFQTQNLNPDAKEFVPPSAKPKQTLNLTHAILVPEEEDDTEDAYYKKESSKYPGRFYYVHKKTGATTWKAPKKKAEKKEAPEPVKSKKESELTAEALSQEISKTMSQLSSGKVSGGFDDTDGCSTDAGAEQTGESDFDSDFSKSSCSKNILPSLGKLVMKA